MEKWTIEYLREHNLIAYEYRRGSHMYHLNVATSDEDTGGVFICPPEMLEGLRSEYVEQVSDEKNDTVFYEFGRWIELLLKSNPTALESLFAPKDCIIGEVHPAVQYVLDHKDAFLSKECFKTFYGYAVSQIGKARGLNKKIVNPVTERKEVLDFCYTFKHQGSQPIKDWLAARGMKQEYCGLVNVPNMKDTYAVFYDWGNHFKQEIQPVINDTNGPFTKEKYDAFIEYMREHDEPTRYLMPFEGRKPSFDTWIEDNLVTHYFNFIEAFVEFNDIPRKNETLVKDIIGANFIRKVEPIGYRGIVGWSNDPHESNEVRLSSIPDKHAVPVCHIYYNKDAYTCHCRDYKEYKEWEEKRNQVRYEGNLGHNYDSKNVMHCMRLIRMAKELAQGKGFNVVRTEDREYLLNIRNHQYEYEDVMAQVEQEKAEMEEAVKTCTLREVVDYEYVNQILIDARKKYVFNK